MKASMLAALIAAGHPGPAAHIALLGAVIIIGLIVFAIVRVRRKRDAAEAQRASETDTISQPRREPHDPAHEPPRSTEGER